MDNPTRAAPKRTSKTAFGAAVAVAPAAVLGAAFGGVPAPAAVLGAGLRAGFGLARLTEKLRSQ